MPGNGFFLYRRQKKILPYPDKASKSTRIQWKAWRWIRLKYANGTVMLGIREMFIFAEPALYLKENIIHVLRND